MNTSPMRFLFAALTALATLALLATSCGADADITTAAVEPTPEPVATAEPTATPEPTAAPEPITTPEATAPAPAAIDSAELSWVRSSILDYEYTMRVSCECDESATAPRRVRVEHGRVVSVRNDGEPSDHRGFSIDELFAQARSARFNNKLVEMEFDANGVPTSGIIDVEATWVDGGFVYEISDFAVITEGAPVDDTYLTALAQWRDANIGSYFLGYAPTCFCMPAELDVTVTNGTITNVVNVVTDPDAPSDWSALTVDDMFVALRNAIVGGANDIGVDYHPTQGRPVSFFIDVDEFIADEEWGVQVYAFEPRKYDPNDPGEAAFCDAFDQLTSIDDTPATAEVARQNMNAMTDAVASVIATAPADLEPGARELELLIGTVYRLAEDADWDPAVFDDLEQDVLIEAGIDADLLNTFFDSVDEACDR